MEVDVQVVEATRELAAALAPRLRVRPAPAPGREVPPPPGARYVVEGDALVDRVVGRRMPVRSVERARHVAAALNRQYEHDAGELA